MQYNWIKVIRKRHFSTSPRSSQPRRLTNLIRLLSICGVLGALCFGFMFWRTIAASYFTISTVAGSAGTSAADISFNTGRGVAFQPGNGNIVYVADTNNHIIRKFDFSTPTPTVTIAAGQFGVAASDPTNSVNLGDDGQAMSARLNKPSDIVLDSSGNLYIADSGDNRIRKVATDGTITTVVGTGSIGATDGNGTNATLNDPRGLGIDGSGNLYIADTGNHLIRKFNGTTVTKIAGNGTSGFSGDGAAAIDCQLASPLDVAIDAVNKIYIADTGNNRIRVVTTDGNINTLAGTGASGFNGDGPIQATSLSLSSPSSVVLNTINGGLFVSDTGNNRVRFIAAGGIMYTLVGTSNLNGTVAKGYDGDGTATQHSLFSPYGIAYFIQGADASTAKVVFLDADNNRLRMLNLSTSMLTTLISDGSAGFSGDNGSATSAKLNAPLGVAVDSSGSVYLADSSNHVIRKITGGTITTIAGTPGVSGSSGEGVLATTATLNKPTGIAIDANGTIYFSDTGNNMIRKITGGIISTALTSAPLPSSSPNPPQVALNAPQGLSFDSLGTLYIADTGNHRIVRFITGLAASTVVGTGELGVSGDNGAATSARLNFPQDVATDPTSGNIYIADTGNHRVRFVNWSTGKISTVVSTGLVRPDFSGDGGLALTARLDTPVAVTVDSGGALYISDRGNNRIRRVVGGIINTIIGSGAFGFSGDGGNALLASMRFPNGLAITSTGLYLADTGNSRIRFALLPDNSAPVLNSPGNQTVSEGSTLSFTLSATESDAGQTLSYSMSGAPTGATLDPSSGAFSYTPDYTVAPNIVSGSTVFNVTFTATDSGSPAAADSKQVTITVNNVNRAPTVNAAAINSPVEATSAAGALIQLSGSGSDLDGDSLTFTWKDGNTTIANAATGSATLGISASPHSLTLTASDGKGGTTTTNPINVLVQDTTGPVLAGVPSDINQTISSGNSASVNFSTPTATDAVDGVRTVITTRSDGQAGNVFPVGQTTVTFTASDTRGNTSTASFKVTITDSSQQPQNTSYDIKLFAGSGNYGMASNSGPAATAVFKQPSGVAVDAAGNLYVADAESRVIRRINGTSVFTFAGTGAKGSGGDGGLAISASFNNPTGLALDSSGNLYIADTNNNRIRKIVGSTISTIAGNGVAGFSGDGGTATSASLNHPTAIAIDGAGNIYIADTGNNRIRKIVGTTISTFAGSGIAGFSGDNAAATSANLNLPSGVAVSSDGNTLYIADTGNNRVRKVAAGTITTFAGNGTAGFGGDGSTADQAALNAPRGLALDANGNLLIADSDNERLRRVKVSDNKISTIAGTGMAGNTGDGSSAINATLDTPIALAFHSATGNLYVADTGNLRFRQLTPAVSNNTAPVIAAIPSSSINVGQMLDIGLSATDADGDQVTFSLPQGSPAFLSLTNINPQTRSATLHVAPACANLGLHNLTVQASDGKATATSPSFTLTINDSLNTCGSGQNLPPVAAFNQLANPIEATSPGGAIVNLNASSSNDPNGDTLTYQWTDNGAVFASTVIASRTLTLGSHTIQLTVSDGKGGTNSASQTVLVRDTTPPTISVSPNVVTFTQGQTVVLPTPTVSDAVDTSVTVTNNAPANYPLGDTIVTFTATDDNGNSAMTTLTVTINSPGGTPSVSSITPTSGKRGQTISMTITGTGFMSGADVTFTGGGITVSNVTVNSTQITLTVKIAANATLSNRTVTVTNPNSESSSLSQAFQIK